MFSVTKCPITTLDKTGMTRLKFCYLNKTELWFKAPSSYRVIKQGSHSKCKVWDISDRLEALFVFSVISYKSYLGQHILQESFHDDKPFEVEPLDLELNVLPHKMKVFSLVKFLWNMAGDALRELGKGKFTLAKLVRLESIALDLMNAAKNNLDDKLELHRTLNSELLAASVYCGDDFTKQSSLVVLLDRIRILKDRIPHSQGGIC